MITLLSPYEPYLIATLLIFFLLTLIQMLVLQRRLSTFMKGKIAKDFEGIILETLDKVHTLENNDTKIQTSIDEIRKRLSTSLRNASLLRFKAIEGTASNQSFSIALLDELGNGLVISSLHVRDRISIYGKKIMQWKSEVELTEEEKEVIKESKGKNNSQF